MLKRVSGGDTVQARFLHGNTFEFTPQFSLWIVGNERPHVSDLDSGAWRRIREIPFVARFAKPDPTVRQKLRNPKIAGPAVLAWMVAGSLAWQSEGLGDVPTAIADATREYREDMNPLSEWMEERTAQIDEWTAFKALFTDYKSWAESAGVRRPLGTKTFSNRLGEYFAPERQGHAGERGFRGIALR